MGFLQLQAGEYMVVITGRSLVGSMCGSDIYRAHAFQILPVFNDLPVLSEQQMREEQMHLHLLEDYLKHNSFYLSYTYALTLTVQQQMSLGPARKSQWQEADVRFFSNRFLAEKLINATMDPNHPQDFSAFILPVIQGFVSITPCIIKSRHVTFGLISRRSQERAGTRYFSRGLDSKGHASNFVESEQILSCDLPHTLSAGHPLCFSFVQTRGSVPVRWSQIPNTRYTPELWIPTDVDKREGLETSRAHFDQQIQLYGPQLLINLTNKKGYELPVSSAYRRSVELLGDPRLFYVHFDFHHECRNMRWHRVQLLIDMLEPELRKQEYCFVDYSNPSAPVLRKTQTSVARTNCMDCLDRTNVVQSTLAKWVLNLQLRESDVLQSTEIVENNESFMTIFNNVWADNADILSIAYSGTSALKTDYTRTGRRTYMGALSDLKHSIIRYIKNNYADGERQDGIDLFTGQYRHGMPIRNTHVAWKTRMVPYVLIISLLLFLCALLFPDILPVESSTVYVFILSFVFTVVIVTWEYVQKHGREYVNWPRLVSLRWVSEDRIALPTQWPTLRTNSKGLEEAEQGHELSSMKKKT
ncbi:SacI homology domain-containing protein [Spinellus fusiger]|nr:SacI homology domain-containing protein [Spinellus fusiger]